jgi:hypothetical protein
MTIKTNDDQPMLTLSVEAFDYLLSNMTETTTSTILREGTQEIDALISSIEQFGFSRGLNLFANHNGMLGGAVPAVAALEAMEADLSAEESAAILQSLKDIRNDMEPAVEASFAWTLMAILNSILKIISIVFWALVAYALFVRWRRGDFDNNVAVEGTEQKKERIASVIHYDVAMALLRDVGEVPAVFSKLEHSKLPKTEEEHKHWVSEFVQETAHLAKLGVHVDAEGHVSTTELPARVSTNIEHVGYTEHSLANIGTAAKSLESVKNQLKSFSSAALEKQEKDATPEERKFVHSAIKLIDEVIHVTGLRIAKALHLVDQNCAAIKHFYEKA